MVLVVTSFEMWPILYYLGQVEYSEATIITDTYLLIGFEVPAVLHFLQKQIRYLKVGYVHRMKTNILIPLITPVYVCARLVFA